MVTVVVAWLGWRAGGGLRVCCHGGGRGGGGAEKQVTLRMIASSCVAFEGC